ncbi:hypothetical protein CAEBREN_09486 [Caenorhabditis brenneri]|uniref:Uncharacterized protein n=1 Tax=Caenorhabditis brenneri TaxID=135651 RepID=G0N919_CAEBE|nr:hypothetical protein CAEBREN_09486 [Caenorhabditis brenneri]
MLSVGLGFPKGSKEAESEKIFDYYFFSSLAFMTTLTSLHFYFYVAKKKFLIKDALYFPFFLKLHLVYLYSFCCIVLLSVEFNDSLAFSSAIRFLSFVLTMVYGFSNIGGTFTIITLLNTVQLVYSIRENIFFYGIKFKRRTMFLIILGTYIIWTQPCNKYDPFTYHFRKTNDDPFTINPLNVLAVTLTSTLLVYKVFRIKKSKKRLLIINYCRIFQMISTVAIIECYMIYTHSSALIIGYQPTQECTFDAYLLLMLFFIHFFYLFSALMVEKWYFWNNRVAPLEDSNSEIENESNV